MDAKKEPHGPAEAKSLLKKATKVLVMKGQKIVTYTVKDEDPNALAAVMLGPTGNLRAPTVLHKKTLLVGFNANAYDEEI